MKGKRRKTSRGEGNIVKTTIKKEKGKKKKSILNRKKETTSTKRQNTRKKNQNVSNGQGNGRTYFRYG